MENNQHQPEYQNMEPVSQGFLKTLQELWRHIVHFIQDITNIHEGADQAGTITSIMNNKKMRGSNVWLLFSAIIVASIGLDTNSPAVIIGAMLISPLMSPILGIGLSIGINNRVTLYQSIQHFGIAIAVSLITSFLYFSLTPLSSDQPTTEMIARTSPTFLDVLVAFFGGIAGIVSGSRLEKSNAIPGVAIATALLPPLCVSGYGLAHGEFMIFLNSFYLFFINSVFVALATYLIVRMLDFPYKEYVNDKEKKRAKWLITGFVVLVIVPSAFIFYSVLQDLNQKRFVKNYVEKTFPKALNVTEPIKGTDSLELTIFWFDEPLSSVDSLKHAEELGKHRVGFKVVQSNYSRDFAQSVRRSVKLDEVLKNLEEEKKTKQQLAQEKQLLQVQIDSIITKHSLLTGVYQEYQKTYPELEKLGYGEIEETVDSGYVFIPTLLFKWDKRTPRSKQIDYEKRILTSFQARFGLDTLASMRYY